MVSKALPACIRGIEILIEGFLAYNVSWFCGLRELAIVLTLGGFGSGHFVWERYTFSRQAGKLETFWCFLASWELAILMSGQAVKLN
jgi:hypothetical protein